jgi:hypothetical protein
VGWVVVAGLAAAAPALRPLHAQEPPAGQAPHEQRTAPVIKWGKWAAAAAAVGFMTLGVRQHNAGDAAFSDLVHYCRTSLCALTPDGRYADPQAEARYQRVVRDDRSARVWLVAGQVSAIGAAVLFVLELRSSKEPPNIPYSGLVVEAGGYGTRVGWRIDF